MTALGSTPQEPGRSYANFVRRSRLLMRLCRVEVDTYVAGHLPFAVSPVGTSAGLFVFVCLNIDVSLPFTPAAKAQYGFIGPVRANSTALQHPEFTAREFLIPRASNLPVEIRQRQRDRSGASIEKVWDMTRWVI